LRLYPWQRLVLDRALEVNAAGEFCWQTVIVSTPRQAGKGVLIMIIATARAEHAPDFGIRQTILHVSNNLRSAQNVHRMAWKWAADRGLHVSRAVDSSEIRWPDHDSTWRLASTRAIWGQSASLTVLDECWDVDPAVFEVALGPTLLQSNRAQAWLLSTANAGSTGLMEKYRAKALGGDPRTLIMEWSSDGDPDDPVSWRAASPIWSAQRAAILETFRGVDGFAEQYLNRWPSERPGGSGWPAGWGACPRVMFPPPWGCTGAVEASHDLDSFGVAVARGEAGRVQVWSRQLPTLVAAVQQLAEWRPSMVFVGMTIATAVEGSWEVRPVGAKETKLATPIVAAAVRDGLLDHDHDRATLAEVAHARTVTGESGPVLSPRASRGSVATIKAATWSSWAVLEGIGQPVKPQIW
jgi:hypothetical protein